MKKINLETVVMAEMSGQRLDQVLSRSFPEYSREWCKQWILEGAVLVDGVVLRPKDKVVEGQPFRGESAFPASARCRAPSAAACSRPPRWVAFVSS